MRSKRPGPMTPMKQCHIPGERNLGFLIRLKPFLRSERFILPAVSTTWRRSWIETDCDVTDIAATSPRGRPVAAA